MDSITDMERKIYQRKMEKWADEYPMPAMMVFGKQTYKEKVKIMEEYYGVR